MKFKYEMHQHTWPCSHCARANPETLVKQMKADGLAGLILTDHFYRGNSGIDRSLPWNEFCKGYEDNFRIAYETGKKIDFDVLFGIEEHIGRGKEVLLYGIHPDFLYKYPELKECSLERMSELVRKENGVIIQAHPFRNRDYIPDPDEIIDPDCVDGFEVYNSCNKPEDNEKAKTYADKFDKIQIAGSDCHADCFEKRAGIVTDRRIRTEEELAEILKAKNFEIFTP